MLVKNIDVKRGLANGSRGVVVDFSKSGAPVVKFRSGLQQTMHLGAYLAAFLCKAHSRCSFGYGAVWVVGRSLTAASGMDNCRNMGGSNRGRAIGISQTDPVTTGVGNLYSQVPGEQMPFQFPPRVHRVVVACRCRGVSLDVFFSTYSAGDDVRLG
jgi:hypothetical protein